MYNNFSLSVLNKFIESTGFEQPNPEKHGLKQNTSTRAPPPYLKTSFPADIAAPTAAPSIDFPKYCLWSVKKYWIFSTIFSICSLFLLIFNNIFSFGTGANG